MTEHCQQQTDNTDKQPYTTVGFGMRGYYAVLMGWYEEDNMWDVTNTSDPSFKDRKGAVLYAQEWAEAEGIKCVVDNH